MSRQRWLVGGAFLALSSSLPLHAQEPPLRPFRMDDDRPVMRAEPVSPPRSVPADPVESTPPAAPAATPRMQVATPIPVRRARPVRNAEAAATPAPKATPAAPSPEPSEPGEIRISPQAGGRSPDQAQLAVADTYYSRKMYEAAAPEYQRYLDQYPGAEDVQAAMFRLAESYRRMGSTNLAKAAYDALLSRFQVGDFVGAAAYRLAEIYYTERNYTSALPYYRKAALRLKEPAVAAGARFYTARCLEASGNLGNKLEASEIYRELAESARETNPFCDASRLSYALLLKEADRTSEALKQIQLLAKQTDNPDLKAEATVRAGLWELDSQQPAKAQEDLKKALELPNIGKWKEVAQVGLLRLYYDTGKYKQVLEGYTGMSEKISADVLPEVLLLVANSNRQLSTYDQAMSMYEKIAKDYPGSAYAKEASYQRLVCLYNSENPKLLTEIDGYLNNLPDTQKRDQVMLMKAESLFKKEDFANAEPVYAAVSLSNQLPAALKAEALFKLGWVRMQNRNYDGALKTFTQYIDENPTSKQLCSARVQRAIANQSLKNFAAAEKDYTEVIKRFPGCKERELALQQGALIRGQMNDMPGMAETFETLLRDYPKSLAAAEANYWIGRAAYEAKDYKKAANRLAEARKLDKTKYFEQTTLSLMLAYYYLEDRESVAREVDLYKKEGKQQVPTEVVRWLSDQYFENKAYDSAERFLLILAERDDVLPHDLLELGQTYSYLAKYPEAVKTFSRYLEAVHEPVSRAKGLLELGRAQIGSKDLDAAQRSVNEVLTLQPEGRLSGEAKILAGDIETSRGNHEAAAKLYYSVSLQLDDEEVTPRALEKAVGAYQLAGKEQESRKVLNQLQSRYPEYMQRKKAVGAKPAVTAGSGARGNP